LIQTTGLALDEIDALFDKKIVWHVEDENLEKIDLTEVEVPHGKDVAISE
jgi:hypothetical protein